MAQGREPSQSAAAAHVFEGFTTEARGFISTVTLVETAWVLAGAYRTPGSDIAAVIEGLSRAREIVVEQSETHYLALCASQTTTSDTADAVIAQTGKRAGCAETVTFDRQAAKGGKMRLLEPVALVRRHEPDV